MIVGLAEWINKTGVINDSYSQPTVPAGSDFHSMLKFWNGRTDNLCENSDYYLPGLLSATWIKIMYWFEVFKSLVWMRNLLLTVLWIFPFLIDLLFCHREARIVFKFSQQNLDKHFLSTLVLKKYLRYSRGVDVNKRTVTTHHYS